jgi:FAD:protein FMN transferase
MIRNMSDPVLAWSMTEFRAMGSPCRIVAPSQELAAAGEALVHVLERRWSRFSATSEITQLNRHSGRVVVVSAETYALIERAEEARRATLGAFNPLALDHLVALGYDRSWEHIERVSTIQLPASTPPVSDEPIELFPSVHAVRLPEGTRFDPGGIGKGLAGDMVAEHLVRLGAKTAQIELGGDVRLVGPPWYGESWRVSIQHPNGVDRPIGSLTVPASGVATSSVLRRSWRRGDRTVHHLIDPTTGTSAVTDLAAVTAVAPELWWAEVVAKIALMAGSTRAADVMRSFGVSGALVGMGDHNWSAVVAIEEEAA